MDTRKITLSATSVDWLQWAAQQLIEEQERRTPVEVNLPMVKRAVDDAQKALGIEETL